MVFILFLICAVAYDTLVRKAIAAFQVLYFLSSFFGARPLPSSACIAACVLGSDCACACCIQLQLKAIPHITLRIPGRPKGVHCGKSRPLLLRIACP